jgi:hypothetical protein
MAHATKQIDQQYSAAYKDAAADCLGANEDWTGYDLCMEPWEEGADAVKILHSSALALDTASSRKSFQVAGCRWFRAVTVVDALSPVDLPATDVALASRWRRKC